MIQNFDPYNEYGVFLRGMKNVYHSGSPRRYDYWTRSRCGIETGTWASVPFRLLDPARVRPCKKCYPNERQET